VKAFKVNLFYRGKKTWLYYIKIKGLYKIGVTLDKGPDSIHNRFKKDKTNIDIIDKFLFQDGADAYDIEQFIIKDNNNCKYIGENVLVSGNSELFTTDIMQYK